MNEQVQAIANELAQITQAINANGEQRPLNVVFTNFGIAGLTRAQLAKRASELVAWIDAANTDDISEELAVALPECVSSLAQLRAQTVPNLFSGNANLAIPAYLLTLDAVERCLRPMLYPNELDVREATKALRTLANRVRNLTAQSNAVQPKIDQLQTMADEIVRAHDAADRLPTDLQALEEARIQIAQALKHAENNRSEMEKNVHMAETSNSSLAESATRAEKIIAQCESAMRASTAVGLAGAFHDRAEALRKSLWPWVFGLISALIAGAVVGGTQLHQLSETIQSSTAPTIVWTRIAVSLLSVGAPVWFAWLATKQIGQRFRLAEDYAYKASISKAYEGYRREAADLDEDFQKRLFASALTRLDEQPLRFVEHPSYGSPWHELLASDVVKDAIRIAPQLVGEWKQKAAETVVAAKTRRKGSAKTGSDDAAGEQGST